MINYKSYTIRLLTEDISDFCQPKFFIHTRVWLSIFRNATMYVAPVTIVFNSLFIETALADSECGPPTGGIIICNPSTYIDNGSGDIRYQNQNGLLLESTNTNLTVSPTLTNRQGILISTGSNAAFTGDMGIIWRSGNIITGDLNNIGLLSTTVLGRFSDGLRVENRGQGSTLIRFLDGGVTTYGYNAAGIYAWQRTNNPNNANPVTVEFSGVNSSISTFGAFSAGLYGATATGLGDIYVSASDGSIITRGTNSVGVRGVNQSQTLGASGNIEIIAQDLTVNTLGQSSDGISADNQSTGQSLIQLSSGSSIQTLGNLSRAAFAATNGTIVDISVRSSNLSTQGNNSHGIYGLNRGQGDVIVRLENSSVSTSGSSAHGVFMQQSDPNATGIVQMQILGSSINAIGANADAVRLQSSAYHEITITGGQLNSGTGDAAAIKTLSGAGATSNIIISGNTVLNGSNSGRAMVTGDANDQIMLNGGILNGIIQTGGGDDMLTITETANITDVLLLDGGTGSDTLNLRGTNFSGYTPVDLTPNTGKALLNWQSINLQNSGTLKLSGNLFSGSSQGTLSLNAGSTLDLKGNSPGIFTIFGDVINAGVLDLRDGAANDVTSITGNYTGNNARIQLDTFLGDDSSATDRLIVNGNSSGTTVLAINPVGGNGALTTNGIQIIQVDGNSATNSFVLASPARVGAYEYLLFQGLPSDPADPLINNDWYLRSTYQDGRPILRSAVASYVMNPLATHEMGFNLLGTLHSRIGEAQIFKWDYCKCDDTPPDQQYWGRISAQNLKYSGDKQFSFRQNAQYIQVGRDIQIDYKRDPQDRGRVHKGIMLGLAFGNQDFRDDFRSANGLINDAHSNNKMLAIGAYRTAHADNGSYLDVAGQLNFVRNEFRESGLTNTHQNGLGIGLSIEAGRPWQWVNTRLLVEPQAQLVYQKIYFRAFETDSTDVNSMQSQSLRGRTGLRLSLNDAINHYQRDSTQTFSVTTSIVRDFLNPSSVQLNDLRIKERTENNTWLDIDFQVQMPLAKLGYFYGGLQYQKGIGSTERDAVAGSLGLKYLW